MRLERGCYLIKQGMGRTFDFIHCRPLDDDDDNGGGGGWDSWLDETAVDMERSE